MNIKTIEIPEHIKKAISDNLRAGRRQGLADYLRQNCRRWWGTCAPADKCLMCQAADELDGTP